MMQRRSVLAAMGALAVAAACGKKSAKSGFGEAKQKYALRGVVRALHPGLHTAVIEHEKIGDWMEAMTMEFPVPSPEDYAKLKVGATIRATVNVSDLNFWLTGIEVE